LRERLAELVHQRELHHRGAAAAVAEPAAGHHVHAHGRGVRRLRAVEDLHERGPAAAEGHGRRLRAIQTFARRCDLVEVTDAVLGRVGRPFPVEPVRTLDAVHLATAEALGEPPQLLTVVTRDHRVRDNARALDYIVN